MSERDRLELLSYYGLKAWQGLKALAAGIDVVIDPDVQQEPAGAENAPAGPAVPEADQLAEVPFTLAVYPGSGAALAEQALGVAGRLLPADGDPDVEATVHDLAWLPLKTGRQVFSRVAGGRLVAVGGYRRAGLVRFESAAHWNAHTWCALGEDALAEWVPPHLRQPLIHEESEKLLAAMERHQVQTALLGGPALAAALALPGAALTTELEPVPHLEIIPVWGLFSSGRVPALTPAGGAGIWLVPVDAIDPNQELTGALIS